jgi:hypothetical protein
MKLGDSVGVETLHPIDLRRPKRLRCIVMRDIMVTCVRALSSGVIMGREAPTYRNTASAWDVRGMFRERNDQKDGV